MVRSHRQILALGVTLAVSVILIAFLVIVKARSMGSKVDTFEDRSLCRTVALRAVEYGAAPAGLSAIRDACVDVYSKRG